jgi:hypothetical protein
MFTFTAAAYNLVRMRNLMRGAQQAAVCLNALDKTSNRHF